MPSDGVRRQAWNRAPGRIGFFGEQRHERGGHLVFALAERLLGAGYQVVIQDSGGYLSIAGDAPPNLTVLGFVDDLAAEIARCDLVIWPSDPERYRGRSSTVVAEAIASGVPLAMPRNCRPAEMVGAIGSGAFFDGLSVGAVLGAIGRAVRDYPLLAAAAAAGAERWAETEGNRHLAALIVREAGG
jgi:glycosyltransferase involved in cell wall biosynthesis